MIIEPGKFYKTRHGRKVRIYAADGSGFPIHGAILLPGGGWVLHSWATGGYSVDETAERGPDIIAEWAEPHPLANAKPGDVVWVRDAQCGPWELAVFDVLKENAAYPVFVRHTSGDESSNGWRFGKPYVPGEKP